MHTGLHREHSTIVLHEQVATPAYRGSGSLHAKVVYLATWSAQMIDKAAYKYPKMLGTKSLG